MEVVFPVILIFLSFFISLFVNKRLIGYFTNKGVMDIPNERSSHSIPTPRGGGIGIVASTTILGIVYAIYFKDYNILYCLLPAVVVSITGFLDDFKGGLSIGIRFIIYAGMGIIPILKFGLITTFPFPEPLNFEMNPILGWAIALIWIAGVTNIYNFLDGIDGFAGMQAVVVSALFAFLFYPETEAFIFLIILFAALGFLVFNWHKAKIFMGDTCSAYLGFLFAVLPFYLMDKEFKVEYIYHPSEFFFITGVSLWFFLSDGVFTIIRRTLKGEKPWSAHRSHLYQRLTIAGWKHNQVVTMVIFLYILLFSFVVYMMIYFSAFSWYVVLWMLVLFIIYFILTYFVERKHHRKLNVR